MVEKQRSRGGLARYVVVGEIEGDGEKSLANGDEGEEGTSGFGLNMMPRDIATQRAEAR